MSYEACLLIDIDKGRKDDPVLMAELETWIFGDNYEKICKIKKTRPEFVYESNVLQSLYELHFFKGEDATAFKIKFQYCLVDNAVK